MVPCPWFREIAEAAAADPVLDLGIHLTLTSEWANYRWAPISTVSRASGLIDDEGYFVFQARTDDMIISAGYNIAGPEVENALLLHRAVAECGVVGMPDEERGQIVKAFVVLKAGHEADERMARELQDFVKRTIAPYKYPRAMSFVTSLPRTETGKLQRFRLRQQALAKSSGVAT